MKSFATKRASASAGWLLALLLPACIDYQETIEVKADGTVELRVYATIVQAALPMVKNRPELKQLLLLPTDPAAAKGMIPDSVHIKYWQVEDGPGIRIVDAAVVIDNLNDLQTHIGAFAASQNFKLFRSNDGNYHYEREVPAYPINDQSGLTRSFLQKQLQNSNLEFHLKVPTKIVATNGQRLGDNEVKWQTSLVGLRSQGLSMQATVEPPPEWPAGLPGLAVAMAVCATAFGLFLRYRTRSRAASQNSHGPLE